MAVLLASLVPESKALLELPPDELAHSVMRVLLSLSPDSLNLYNLLLANTFIQGYPSDHESINAAVSGAWEWLRGQGYLAQKPGSSDSKWMTVTPQGRRWCDETF